MYNNRFNMDAINQSLAEQSKRKNEAIDSTNLLAEFQRANLASKFADKLITQMRDFDNNLDSDHEVGMKLVSFGQTITFHIHDVGYCNPSMIVFYGYTDEANKVELIQHVSQISFLLLALPKLNPEEPKRQIGFIQS